MKNFISKQIKAGLLKMAGVAIITGILCSSVQAQLGQVLYGGGPSETTGIKIGSWGGGIAKEVKGAYGGSRTIDITPSGLFAGGRIDFANAFDIRSIATNENSYIQVVAKFGSTSSVTTGGMGMFGMTMPGAPGGGAMNTMPGMPANVMGGGMRGGTMAGMPSTLTNKPIPSKRMQLILEMIDGKFAEAQVNLADFTENDDGWMELSFPISVFKRNLQADNFIIKRIIIAGDGNELIKVSEVRTDIDPAPLTANAGDDKEVAINDRVSFNGSGSSGNSSVIYSWDFDASDGIQHEGQGQIVYHRFREEGTFTVTLTVMDEFGIKEPATSTVTIKVNR